MSEEPVLDEAGVEAAVRECARISVPTLSDADFEEFHRAPNSDAYWNTKREMTRVIRVYSHHALPTRAIADVAAERRRQQTTEGWTPEHDDEHRSGELAQAAACYVLWGAGSHGGGINGAGGPLQPPGWPWHRGFWKPKDRRRDLVRAGALILAEIERLDRAERQ